MAASVLQGEGKAQFGKVAQDLMDWSNRNRERVGELVRTEVRSQMKQLGVASRDEVDSLRRRVRELEKAQGAPKRTAAKRTHRQTRDRATTAKPSTRHAGARRPARPSRPRRSFRSRSRGAAGRAGHAGRPATVA